MDLIEKVEETFEDVGNKFKKIDKKKLLIVGGIGATILGLIVFIRKKDSQNASSYNGVVATNGAGDIPYSNSEMPTQTETFNQLYEDYNDGLMDLAEQYNTELTGIKSQYNQSASDMQAKYDSIIMESTDYYETELAKLTNTNDSLLNENQTLKSYSNDIDYALYTSSLLASGLSGSSDKVVDATISRASKIADNDSLSKYVTTYDKNVDYQSAINKAIESGASQDVIDVLNAQRNAKIDGEGLSYSKNESSKPKEETVVVSSSSSSSKKSSSSSKTSTKPKAETVTVSSSSSSSEMNKDGKPRWIFGD